MPRGGRHGPGEPGHWIAHQPGPAPAATVAGVSDGADRRGWRRAVDAQLKKMQQPDLHLGQFALVWAGAISVVFVGCALFFLTLYWIFS